MRKFTLVFLFNLFIGLCFSQDYVITVNYLGFHGNVSQNSVVPNQWHYIAFTKASGLTGKLYIDGVLVRDTIMWNVSYNYSKLYLGTSQYGGFSGYFKGYIDEIRVSNVVRSQTEIQNYYSSNLPFTADGSTFGLWHFDETSGTTINNAVGGSGSISGGASFQLGKFSNCLYFDGINGMGDCNVDIPENDITIEFWFKHDGTNPDDVSLVQPYGAYSTNISLKIDSTTVGLNELNADNNSLRIYPNPTYKNLNIAFKTDLSQDVVIQIYDNIGKLILKEKIANSLGNFNRTLDVSGLAEGLYTVNVNIGENSVSEKITIMK